MFDGLPDLTIWRAILITGFAVAVYTGRPSRLIIAVMVCNFAATWYLAASPLAVGVADAASALVLLTGNVQSRIIATLFSAMIGVYVPAWLFAVPNYSTYTIIDLIAFLQLGVIGGFDGGIGRWLRGIGAGWRGRFAFRSDLGYVRPNTTGGRAMDTAPSVSEGNGS